MISARSKIFNSLMGAFLRLLFFIGELFEIYGSLKRLFSFVRQSPASVTGVTIN